MRKLLLTTAAVAICLAGCGNGAPNTLIDKRDGQTYKTVKIGQQTWMARNMNYQTDSGSWCYDNKKSNCKKYGKLYYWNAAKTACAAGYHLPSLEEWTALVDYAGGVDTAGKKLKAKCGWGWNGLWSKSAGTNDYGFSALPGGGRYSNGKAVNTGNTDDIGIWWTATEDTSGYVYNLAMYYNKTFVYGDYLQKSLGFSVRCVADNP
jgi:uncharacterized protein (TIGR02145 family)